MMVVNSFQPQPSVAAVNNTRSPTMSNDCNRPTPIAFETIRVTALNLEADRQFTEEQLLELPVAAVDRNNEISPLVFDAQVCNFHTSRRTELRSHLPNFNRFTSITPT